MADIIKRQMKDVVAPSGDLVRRPVSAPEPYVLPPKTGNGDRISNNPFFEKPRSQKGAGSDGRSSHALWWALAVVLVLTGGFMVANYFSSATIEITPVSQKGHLDSDFVAASSNTAVPGDLVFNFVATSTEKTKEIPATIEKKIQKKASGKVVIYNAYNGDSQRLIKNTRLESADHKIFRIDTSVVVPGATMVKGQVAKPGSVEALIYADVAGKEYNIGTSNFTIPGFKGDPRYTKFTAASKTDSPITGGFSGTVKVPTDALVAQAQDELKQDLKKTAIEKARAEIPDGMSLFPGGTIIKFEEVPGEPTVSDTATVTMRATASVFFFDTSMLTEKLVAEALPVDKGKKFAISNMPTLAFSFVDIIDNVVLADVSKIKFHITGDPEFVGQIDTEKIRTDVLGKNKQDFNKIIQSEVNVSNANAVVRPAWKSVFPAVPSKITIKVLTPQ